MWNEEVSAWLDVNGFPDPHTTSRSWIENLSLLGHENPLPRVPHAFIRKTPKWFMKPLGLPLVSFPMFKTSILMSPWSQDNIYQASPIVLYHKSCSLSPSPSILDIQKLKSKWWIHASNRQISKVKWNVNFKSYKGIKENHKLDSWGKQGHINSKILHSMSLSQFMKTISRLSINLN